MYKKLQTISDGKFNIKSAYIINIKAYIARFPFVKLAELLKACHSMSKSSSPHEKSVK